jgi:acetyl esterase/lipase
MKMKHAVLRGRGWRPEEGKTMMWKSVRPRLGWVELAVIAVAFCCGVAGNAAAAGSEEATGPQIQRDLVYAVVDGLELKLDIAVPTGGPGPFPAIVFIHGGAWDVEGGNVKIKYWEAIQEAATRGFVGVTVEFRDISEISTSARGNGVTGLTAQISDIQCAVRWLRAEARTYRIDPDNIGAYGLGSGGMLALLLGLMDPGDDLWGGCEQEDESAALQAIVSLTGTADIPYIIELKRSGTVRVAQRFEEYTSRYVGGVDHELTEEELFERYRLASPITYVDESDPPVLSIVGSEGIWTPIAQSERFDERMRLAGARHTMIVRAGVGAREELLWDPHQSFPVWSFFEAELK